MKILMPGSRGTRGTLKGASVVSLGCTAIEISVSKMMQQIMLHTTIAHISPPASSFLECTIRRQSTSEKIVYRNTMAATTFDDSLVGCFRMRQLKICSSIVVKDECFFPFRFDEDSVVSVKVSSRFVKRRIVIEIATTVYAKRVPIESILTSCLRSSKAATRPVSTPAHIVPTTGVLKCV